MTVRSTRLALVLGSVVLLAACASLAPPPAPAKAQAATPGIAAKQAEAYDGPKARIAVADVEDKTSPAGRAANLNMPGLPPGFFAAMMDSGVGRGMSDMLISALFNTNRYIILEREKIGNLLAEQDLGAAGRVSRQTATPIGEIEGAELLVTGALTGFDPDVQGGGGGASGIPIIGGITGALSASYKKAHIAMDLRVIDTRTSRIVAVTSVEGSASSYSAAVGINAGPIGGSLSAYAKTPMETAIRLMIVQAVDFIVSKTPTTYYHHAGAASAPPPRPAVTPASMPGMPGMPPGYPVAGPPLAPPAGAHPAPGYPTVATRTPSAIPTDSDRSVVATLKEVTRRGAVVSVQVSLVLQGTKAESDPIALDRAESHVLDYQDGKKYELVAVTGFSSGRMKAGEEKLLRATFKAPPGGRRVAVTLAGLGTFDDVPLGD